MTHLYDPISAFQSLGYTKREAAFLYLTGIHSGYFVRRQFDYFIDHNKGAVAMNFIEKATRFGHIEALQYKQGWRVYHLCSRTIYGVLGDAESSLRHRKGDSQIRARLMALDYVLENDSHHYLESEVDRTRFFERDRRIPPHTFVDGNGKLHSLLTAFPISLADRSRPVQSLIRFAFIDEGLLSIGKFMRFLITAGPLLSAIGNFELVYVAVSDFNFDSAEDAFRNCFSHAVPRTQRLFGDDIRSAALERPRLLEAQFTTLLFHYSYPRFLSSEVRGSKEGSIE